MLKNIKKLIFVLQTLIILLCSFSYAKVNPFESEVTSPSAESKVNKSQGIIISNNPYKEYSPLNPVKPGINIEEYEKVNNYVIDLNTVDTRIKYFSPTYLNIKNNASSMYWMAFYARGGNDTLVYNYKNYTEEILDAVQNYKAIRNQYINDRNALKKSDKDYEEKYRKLTIQIETYSKMYNTALITYNTTNRTITQTKSALGLSRALYNIGNVDNNNQVTYARNMVTKSLKSVVMTYLQLENYVDILDKQTKLYYDIYMLNKKNYELGVATSLDVSTSLDDYETTKSSMKSTKNTLKNVKEQIAINLGYDVKDIDKLIFVEPEPNLEYINNIKFDDDKERAYTSNSSYTSIKMSDKDKKYPQSTGENLLHERQNYIANKITNEFESIYINLQAKKLSYDSSLYLDQITKINEEANKRKLDAKLVSEIEYNGLELKNLSDKLQVKIAKYDLINATNEYYYGALGLITIS